MRSRCDMARGAWRTGRSRVARHVVKKRGLDSRSVGFSRESLKVAAAAQDTLLLPPPFGARSPFANFRRGQVCWPAKAKMTPDIETRRPYEPHR